MNLSIILRTFTYRLSRPSTYFTKPQKAKGHMAIDYCISLNNELVERRWHREFPPIPDTGGFAKWNGHILHCNCNIQYNQWPLSLLFRCQVSEAEIKWSCSLQLTLCLSCYWLQALKEHRIIQETTALMVWPSSWSDCPWWVAMIL